MKRKRFPQGMAGALLGFVFLCLACVTAQWEYAEYNGEDSPLLEGSIWKYSDSPETAQTVTFRSGGELYSPWTNSTWERRGNSVCFVGDNGRFIFKGIYYADANKITGTAQNSIGYAWDVTLELIQGTSALNAEASDDSSSPPGPADL
jgi:hypothetical protein